jgi:hypothetical protein
MPKTKFSPAVDGFHFANRFVNDLGNIPGIGPVTTSGRCGGMCFAALDYYNARVAIPPFRESDFASSNGVPPDGNPLADYIYKRQIDSFLVLSATKLVVFALAPDGPTFFLRGVTRWTKEDEWRKLKSSIDAGTPVTLGLVTATDLAGLGHNHQVVAYGYDFDERTQAMTVHVYDNNHPDAEVTLTSDPSKPHFFESTGEEWRGWFVQNYSPQRPPAAAMLATAAVTAAASATKAPSFAVPEQRCVTLTVERVAVHNDGNPHGAGQLALQFTVNGRTGRWPKTGARTVRAGRSYAVKRSFAVDVGPDDALNFTVSGIEPGLAAGAETAGVELPVLADNDEPVATLSRTFMRADRWGAGSHADRSAGSGGAITIYYSIA